jgi:hypothetical protein
MAQEIDINLNVNAEQADKSLGSLKRQLREAQQDVQKLADKFGATSKEAVNAAKKASDLKDRIGDAASLTEAFNPDAKFKALSASLSGVAGGFAAYQGAMGLAGVESKDLEKQLLKVQSAMAIAQGVQALGEARDSFKQLKAVAIDAFNGIKTAIGSTGIGLLVVALGTIAVYWEDIKAAVSGVSEEQKKLNKESQKNVDKENEKLKLINDQDEILKLQGKSEKEILDIKIKQTNEAIAANKINQENQILNNKLALEGAERNYEMLKSFIDFISIPQRLLFENGAKAINKIIDLINKIPGIDLKYKIDEKFADESVDYLTKLAFDPEKVKKDGDATVKASKETLTKLENDRAGYINSKKDIDKKDSEDAAKKAEDDLKALKESRKKSKEDDEAIRNEITQAISDAQEKQSEFLISAQEFEERAVKDKYFRLLEYAKKFGLDTKDLEIAKANELNDIRLKAQEKQKEIDDKKAAEDVEREQKKSEAIQSFKENLNNIISGIEASGIAKSKAGQALSKSLALTQIGIDTAVAIGNASKLATAEGAKAAAVGGPGAGTIARIVSYASSYAQVLTNFMRAKTMLSSGGSGGGGGAAGGGGGAEAAAPSFNVVGPSGANQIAESMGARESQPMRAFVVGGDVTTQQGLNRGIVQNATLG